MRAAGIRRVEQVGVAGAQSVAVAREHRLHGGAHGAQVHGQVRRVGHQAALAVEHGATEVQTLLDVHRAGGVLQGGAHLLGDGHEEVVEDLQEQRGASGEVGRGGRRRGAAPQQQLTAGQDLGAPARLDDGGAGGLRDHRRAVEERARREAGARVDRRLVPRAGREQPHGLRGRRRGGGRALRPPGPRPRPRRASSPAPTASTARASIVRPRSGMTKPYRRRCRAVNAAAIVAAGPHGTASATSVPAYLTWA